MSASYLVAKAAQIQMDDLMYSPREVRSLLLDIASELEPGDVVDQQLARIPVAQMNLAEHICRVLFRGERVSSDYGRCVQVSQLLGDSANRLDIVGDYGRAEFLREYAFAVSQAGNAL